MTSTPRLESLHHRLKTAKAPDGQPFPLLDELMVFLEDPPPGTPDRWQAGADLCADHGIPTSLPPFSSASPRTKTAASNSSSPATNSTTSSAPSIASNAGSNTAPSMTPPASAPSSPTS